MKDALDLANERIDQQSERIEHLEQENKAMSDALNRMKSECADLVLKAQHKHFRCACEHGCPTEFAI